MKAMCPHCMGELEVTTSIQKLGEEPEPGTPAITLSHRQLEILSLLEQGLNQKAIAQKLTLAEPTIWSHMDLLFNKLGVRTAPAALAKAIRLKLI